MGFMNYVWMLTGPQWLQNEIGLIAMLLSGSLLVYFGSFVHGEIILPLGDWVRKHTHRQVSNMKRVGKFSNFIANSMATIFFLLYVYFGSIIFAEYIFAPIMSNLRNYILIVVIGLFLIISYAINNLRFRTKFMGS